MFESLRKSKFLNVKNKDLQYIIILLVFYIVIVIVWSDVVLFRLYHLKAAIFDLGMFAEGLWLPIHTMPTVSGILYNVFYVSIIPYLLCPLSLTGGLSIILVVQTLFIWATVFPIYFVSRKLCLSPLLSFIVSLTYFFYFPSAGINFFDVHNQAFFPFFFILSYMFYVYNYKKTSTVLFGITALIKWPYDIFVVLFVFYEICYYFYLRRKSKIDNQYLIHYLVLFMFSSFALIFGYYISFLGGHVSASSLHINNSGQTLALGDISITFLMLLAPLFFLSLFSKKWVIFIIPFFALMAIANNGIYFFPNIFTDQYLSMILPFLFLGLIEVLSTRYNAELKAKKDKTSMNKLTMMYKEIKSSQTTKTILSIMILLILLSLVFQPWSPLENDNGYISWYGEGKNPYDNVNTYSYLVEETAMIPRSNPYVLAPNDIPEVYPRALVGGPYHVGAFVMGFPSPVFLNISVEDAMNNTFPFIASAGHIVYVPLDYAISTITNSVAFSKSGYQSILQIMDIMLQSGKYGIMAEANGTIVLERNYTNSPALYIPMNRYIGVIQGNSMISNIAVGNSIIFSNVSKGSIMWYGGTNYYPGTYYDTLHFLSYLGSYGNISINAILNGTVVSKEYIDINEYNSSPAWYNVSFKQVINNINLNNGYYYFIIRSNGWTGKIQFSGISSTEVSYKW